MINEVVDWLETAIPETKEQIRYKTDLIHEKIITTAAEAIKTLDEFHTIRKRIFDKSKELRRLVGSFQDDDKEEQHHLESRDDLSRIKIELAALKTRLCEIEERLGKFIDYQAALIQRKINGIKYFIRQGSEMMEQQMYENELYLDSQRNLPNPPRNLGCCYHRGIMVNKATLPDDLLRSIILQYAHDFAEPIKKDVKMIIPEYSNQAEELNYPLVFWNDLTNTKTVDLIKLKLLYDWYKISLKQDSPIAGAIRDYGFLCDPTKFPVDKRFILITRAQEQEKFKKFQQQLSGASGASNPLQ